MYAVLHISRFALQATLRTEEGLASLPVVLVDAKESKPRVLDLTKAAEDEGVVIGLLVPQALARCPDLLIRYRSPQAEAMAWEALFLGAYSISPRVERIFEGTCLVDLRGVVLESAKERCVAIVDELAKMGLEVRVGMAASSSVAMLAAKAFDIAQAGTFDIAQVREANGVLVVGRARRPGEPQLKDQKRSSPVRRALPVCISHLAFLDSLTIDAAEPGEALAGILDKWGIRTVGAFARLSRSAVGKRLGKEGLALWDRVHGRDERVVGVTDLPPVFEESWQFEYDVDNLDPLLFLLRRFLDQLCLKLELVHKVAAEVSMDLGLAYGEPIQQSQTIPEPTRDVDALFRMLSGRLEGLEADSPVVRFSIRIEAIDFKQRQLGLFESSLKNPHRFTQTLARVAGVIGSERVGRPVLEADARPDGFHLEPLPVAVPAAEESCLKRHYGMALRRFRPGLKAAVELQGRQPVWFKSERVSGFVKAVRGPWQSSGHWWESDGGWNRVEWDVELRGGGVYRLVKEDGAWKLEGEYD